MLTTAIAPPKTYSDWVAVLDALKEKADDEAVLSAMQKGTIEWQSGGPFQWARESHRTGSPCPPQGAVFFI